MCSCCCGCLKCGKYYASTHNVVKARKKLTNEQSKKMNKVMNEINELRKNKTKSE